MNSTAKVFFVTTVFLLALVTVNSQEIRDPIKAAKMVEVARQKHLQAKTEFDKLKKKFDDLEQQLKEASAKEEEAKTVVSKEEKVAEDIFTEFQARLESARKLFANKSTFPKSTETTLAKDDQEEIPVAKEKEKEKGKQEEKPAPASIVVTTDASAKITIDKTETKAAGVERVFTTAPLEPGREYTYEFIATIPVPGGTAKTLKKQVTVTAGDIVTVSLK